MSTAHLYSDLTEPGPAPLPLSEDEAFEEARLAAYEAGYQAGWEDAAKAQSDEQRQLKSALVQELQDMSFTYREAQAKLTAALQPVMVQMVEVLLPRVLPEMQKVHLLDQLRQLVSDQTAQAISVTVAPANRPAVEAALEGQFDLPFTLSEDGALDRFQIQLRVGEAERDINFDGVMAGLQEALAGFFHANQQVIEDD